MDIFFVITGVSVLGIGAVVWMLIQDKKSSEDVVERLAPEEIGGETFTTPIPSAFQGKKEAKKPPKEKGGGLFGKLKLAPKEKPLSALTSMDNKGEEKKKSGGSLFSKLGLNKSKIGKENLEVPEPASLPSLKDFLDKEKKKKEESSFGSASLKTQPSVEPIKSPSEPIENPTMEVIKKTPLSAEDEQKLEKELDASLELTELRNKHERLEKMFQEKSTALEHSEQALKTERQTQKEFNKIKDILEKELKDTKDNARKTQVELTSTKTESETYKKRIAQLEDKATKLEREIAEKEKEVDALVKKLQTFASPATAATPPKPKEPITAPEPVSPEQPLNLSTVPSSTEIKNPEVAQPLPSQSITPILIPEREEAPENPESGEDNAPPDFVSLKPDILSQPSTPPNPPVDEQSNPDKQTP